MNPSSPAALAPGRRPFERISLARQFLLVSALVLLLGVAAIGTWVGHEIATGEVKRGGQIAAVYVESILAAPLAELVEHGALGADARLWLDSTFVTGPLARKIVRFKLWTPDGRIHYSSRHDQEGQIFRLDSDIAAAFAGNLQVHVTELDGPDNAAERARWQHLIEVYVPLRARDTGRVSAVAEFYESMAEVDIDIRSDQQQSWLVIALGAMLLYAGLYAIVHRASETISGQRSDLESQLAHLKRLLDENRAMNLRLQQAGAQTTSMTELSLRRIAADLHDGPAQDLAFALLTLDERSGGAGSAPATMPADEMTRLRECLQRSMLLLRNIAGGLVVPGMTRLALADVVGRAVADATRKGGVPIAAQIDEGLGDAPEAVKITTYRVLQEALANSLRHAAGHPPRVAARRDGDGLLVEVTDEGPGFDTRCPEAAGHFGLAFLRERVLLLGGSIEIRSTPGAGTTVRARLPVTGPPLADG